VKTDAWDLEYTGDDGMSMNKTEMGFNKSVWVIEEIDG
jgi:hypothetical protein